MIQIDSATAININGRCHRSFHRSGLFEKYKHVDELVWNQTNLQIDENWFLLAVLHSFVYFVSFCFVLLLFLSDRFYFLCCRSQSSLSGRNFNLFVFCKTKVFHFDLNGNLYRTCIHAPSLKNLRTMLLYCFHSVSLRFSHNDNLFKWFYSMGNFG